MALPPVGIVPWPLHWLVVSLGGTVPLCGGRVFSLAGCGSGCVGGGGHEPQEGGRVPVHCHRCAVGDCSCAGRPVVDFTRSCGAPW